RLSFPSGSATRANSSASSTRNISAPSPPALIPKFSQLVSPAANSTNLFSAIFRRARTPAAKTASSTRLSSTVRSSAGPFPFEPAKSSIATVSPFAIYCPQHKELQNENRNLAEGKSALSSVARVSHDCHRRRPPDRTASLELHTSWRDGLILRRYPQRLPSRL